jgi:drug/metabolite transporter (DMT)-like permease
MKDQLVSSDTRLDRFLVHLRLLAVPVIWGSTFVAGRIVAREIPPATASVARYLLACIALAFATRIIEGALPRLNRRQIVATVALGATGGFRLQPAYYRRSWTSPRQSRLTDYFA